MGSWDLQTFGTFYTSSRKEFLAHSKRILGDSGRAEEVVQEAFLRLMLAAPELHGEEHAKAYIYRTINNLCIDLFRIEGRRPKLVALDESDLQKS
ncbi:MAG: RNA polymerase sigma factor, partial [Proteobacteria bacterium]|nr:RNA polymerase sigma factor [Pseudomonadota bacterium]